ncbi:hypothetical protein, partial [Halovibrio sp. HP20-50]|uniref:hypothetical protein n=1 Tax=Halovibrio sp. HP20-59 TaxID=3080275 RepID=UPI00294B4534
AKLRKHGGLSLWFFMAAHVKRQQALVNFTAGTAFFNAFLGTESCKWCRQSTPVTASNKKAYPVNVCFKCMFSLPECSSLGRGWMCEPHSGKGYWPFGEILLIAVYKNSIIKFS